MKDRIINTVLALSSSVIAVIIAFKLSTKDLNARDLRQVIDSKLDKTEFIEYKTDQAQEREKDREDMKYVRERVDDIYKYLLQKK